MKTFKLLALASVISLSPLASASEVGECNMDKAPKTFSKKKSDEMKQKMFDRMDANGDGAISLEEFKNAEPGKKGKRGERPDGERPDRGERPQGERPDGERPCKPEKSEKREGQGEGKKQDKRERPDPSKFFEKLDADSDGVVTKEEFTAFHENHKRSARN